MDALVTADVFLFEAFRFDRRAGGLFRRDDGGALVPVAIGSRALAVLDILMVRQGDLVSKDEIMQTVWPGTVVEDNNLTVQISALRRILDQGRAEGSCIQTVTGRGYRFVAPVRLADPPSAPGAGPLSGNGSAEPVGVENEQAHRPAEPVLLPSSPAATWRAKPRLWAGIIAASLVAVGLVVAVIAAEHWPWRGNTQTAPRLSIVLLPFTNLSADREQQYFADGITEDLTTDLSRLADMLVISRDSAFTYKDKPVNAKQIGRELGVRYVLEGSVQRSGNQVRINAQLIDAESDTHLWAERFDRDMGDLFAIQNEITNRIAVALNLELIGVEALRPSEQPDALDYIFRARAVFLKPLSRDNYAEAIGLYERALALDPASVEARSGLASALASRVLEEMTNSHATDIKRAESLANQALAASPRSPLAHYARGQVLRAQGQYKEAIPEYETAIAFNRNWVSALSALAECKLHAGPIEQVIPLQEQVVRLSPRDPLISNMYGRIGVADVLQSRVDEAIVWLEKARDANPARLPPHSFLAAAYGLKGETERAAAELAEARKLVSDDRFTSIARQRVRRDKNFENPAIRALFETTFFVGLRKAGVPEK